MKLSNFKIMKSLGDREYFATVDVTTGFLWFRKTESRIIHKDRFSSYWRFVDSGEWTPEYQAEKLFAAHELKRKLKELA